MAVPPALKRDRRGHLTPPGQRRGDAAGGAEDNLAQPDDVGVSCPQREQKQWPRPSHRGGSGPFVFPGVVVYFQGWTGYTLTFKAEAEPYGPRSPGPSSQKTRRPPPQLRDICPRQLDPPCFGVSGAMALGLAELWPSSPRRFGSVREGCHRALMIGSTEGCRRWRITL